MDKYFQQENWLVVPTFFAKNKIKKQSDIGQTVYLNNKIFIFYVFYCDSSYGTNKLELFCFSVLIYWVHNDNKMWVELLSIEKTSNDYTYRLGSMHIFQHLLWFSWYKPRDCWHFHISLTRSWARKSTQYTWKPLGSAIS